MASEEEAQGGNNININIHNQAQPPAPVPPTLPPYPEMILAAIEQLNESTGSNRSSISKQIEATYGDLPPAHTTLLTHHLNKMKSTGQLQFLKNNYLKPDPNAPPRRGRGRPPKPKTPLPPGALPPPSRPPPAADAGAPPSLKPRFLPAPFPHLLAPVVVPPNPSIHRLLRLRLNQSPQLLFFLAKNVAAHLRLPLPVYLRLLLPPLEEHRAGVGGRLKRSHLWLLL